MITLLSPSKKLNFEPQNMVDNYTQCEFIKSAEMLANKAKNLTENDLKELMDISDKLAQLNRERFDRWSLPFNSSNAKQAILAFDGGVYSGLRANTFSDKDFGFAQDHLRILSGLYGLLKPFDIIQPYRLEMGTNLENNSGENLYDFWGNTLTKYLQDELSTHSSKFIINCASVEYFKSIDNGSLKSQVVTPAFKEIKNGKPRIVSFFAKKARGMMARYIIQNQINNVDDIKQFDLGGYSYNSDLSQDFEPVFTRAQA